MNKKRPTLKHLEYFVVTASILNFRRAAEQLDISQPTLTAQIAAMEDLLNLQLFERSRSGTWLSPQGRALLPAAKQLLDAMGHFEEAALTLAEGSATTFRLGVPPTLGPYLLPHVLPDLHGKYERLKFYVREKPHLELVQQLIEGEFDIILAPTPMNSPELVVENLFIEPLKFVVPSSHSLAVEKTVKPEQITGENVLTLEGQHHFHKQVQDICEQVGATVLRDYEGTSLDTLRQMIVMGLGVAFLPGLYVHSELHRPEALHVSELEGVSIVRQHALAWRKSSASRTVFRELTKSIRTILKKRLGSVVKVS
ncbi:hydrogen peroxide-inducible genes activator [Agarilytica rhodophyticola]|uniref:hydrogen peroxide-inducible genes activator n=1 Tax=Agarilytica rhodophyticola TaxID=1737490 RepID=UPI000B34276A|nr:hydrogen peroxide-inducible genes activator [Agarilytica rhodophyticola]